MPSAIEALIADCRKDAHNSWRLPDKADQQYTNMVQRIADYRAALALELALLRESLHVLHCGGKTPECPTREREMAAIKRLEGVLGDG